MYKGFDKSERDIKRKNKLKTAGLIFISLALAVFTVIVINF